jgi:hypothetical protein
MANTTNFGWETPDNTDLVKDGALAIRTLGSAIDTSLVDLKGGTTGQVLSKASDTNMDFTWVAQDDANAIQNAIVDAKGDLITATAADTPARLAVGTNGDVLTADSSTATGLKWAAAASGGMTLINTGGTTLSGSSTTISSIPSGYVHLYGEIVGFRPATNNVDLRVQFNNDTNSVYSWIGSNAFNQTSTKFTDGGCNSSSSNGNIQFQIPSYTRTLWKFAEVNSHNVLNTGTSSFFAQNYISVSSITGAITDITFLCSSGNFTSGTVFLYGVK